MSQKTEVVATGLRVGAHTLLECTACGPVAVTHLGPATAEATHLDIHQTQKLENA